MINGSLAMSVTFQKFRFLSCSQATGNNFTISGSPRSRSHTSMMCYSLLGNVCCAKTCSGIFNIPVSISIAHQSIDALKYNFCHFHYNACLKVIKFASSGIRTHASRVNSCCVTIYTKPKIITFKFITGHKKPKKLDI